MLVHVGFDNYVAADRVLAIVAPSSAPVKRLIHQAAEAGHLVDMTAGRKVKAVLVLDNGHLALIALHPETIASRMEATHPTRLATTTSCPETEKAETPM